MTDDNAQLNVTELIATLLMGLAAVAIAWSTYQSALWGGQQDEANTESVRHASKVVDLLQVGDRIKALDQLLFIEVLTSHTCDGDEQGDRIVCEQLLANMSDEGASVVEGWLISGDSDPFESPAYLDALYEQGEAAKLVSEQFFDEAGEANENGDNFELVATILTIVLFFAGISVVIFDRRISSGLLGAASLLLVGATAYVVSLPLA